jgi:hypothetical protein
MGRFRAGLAGSILLLAGCAPTNQPMAQAEAQCMQYALGGGGGVTVGMSVGTGTGNWNNGWDGWGNGRSGVGVGVGMTAVTQLPPAQGMAQVYAQCVQRRTGLPPVTPFDQRPELRG